jgi:hypothetical protein
MGYDVAKRGAEATGGLQKLRNDESFPVLPPNEDVVRFGEEGYKAGLQDYSRTTGEQKPLNLGSGLEPLKRQGAKAIAPVVDSVKSLIAPKFSQ